MRIYTQYPNYKLVRMMALEPRVYCYQRVPSKEVNTGLRTQFGMYKKSDTLNEKDSFSIVLVQTTICTQ